MIIDKRLLLNLATLFLVIMTLISFNANADERYSAKSTAEVEAQIKLLNELYDNQLISLESYKKERQRLKKITYQLTYGQLGKVGSDTDNIVKTQKIDWLSTGLMVVSGLIALVIFIPLLKKLTHSFRTALFKIRTFVRRYFSWLIMLVDFIIRAIARIVSSITTGIKNLANTFKNAPAVIQDLIIYMVFVPLLFIFKEVYYQLPFMVVLSFNLARNVDHYWKKIKSKQFPRSVLFVLSIFWGGFAYWFESSIMGFVAVGLINAFFGFSIGIFPGYMQFGFSRENQGFIFRTSLISLVMILSGWLIFYSHLLPNEVGMQVFMFASGLYFFVPLSFYVAILIVSGNWFNDKPNYAAYNIYAFVCGISLLLLSYLYGMGFLFWIGAIFMVWLFSAKYYELVWKNIDEVYAGALVAIVLGGAGYYIQDNLKIIVDWLSPIL